MASTRDWIAYLESEKYQKEKAMACSPEAWNNGTTHSFFITLEHKLLSFKEIFDELKYNQINIKPFGATKPSGLTPIEFVRVEYDNACKKRQIELNQAKKTEPEAKNGNKPVKRSNSDANSIEMVSRAGLLAQKNQVRTSSVSELKDVPLNDVSANQSKPFTCCDWIKRKFS